MLGRMTLRLGKYSCDNARILVKTRMFGEERNDTSANSGEVKRIPRTFKKMRGTGDKGQTSLFSGEKRWKDDAIFEALGTCDELTCLLGIVREELDKHGFYQLVERITSIQCDIQDISAHLATPTDCGHKRLIDRTKFDAGQIEIIDYWIDEYAQTLPELTQFILPGGGALAAHVHHARSVCRRAERRVATIVRQEKAEETVLKYLNRLSDFLFVLARYSCYAMKREEIFYKKARHPSNISSGPKWKKSDQKQE